MKTNWNYPTTIWVGENRIQDLGLACKNLKIDKPLFVTDKDLIYLKTLFGESLQKRIRSNNFSCRIGEIVTFNLLDGEIEKLILCQIQH